MVIVNVSTASNGVLDYLVFKAQPHGEGTYWETTEVVPLFNPTSNWAQGGPIIEREKFDIGTTDEGWYAGSHNRLDDPNPLIWCNGKTPLEAAMRCFVISKLGNKVEVPDGIIGE